MPHWPFIAQVGRRRRTVFSGHLEPSQPTDQGRRGDQGIRPTAPLLQALPWRAPQEAETCSIEVCVRPVRDSSPDFYPPSFSEHLERVGQAHQNSLSLISPSSKNVCQCSVRSRYWYGKLNNWVRPLNLRNKFVVLLILSTFSSTSLVSSIKFFKCYWKVIEGTDLPAIWLLSTVTESCDTDKIWRHGYPSSISHLLIRLCLFWLLFGQ